MSSIAQVGLVRFARIALEIAETVLPGYRSKFRGIAPLHGPPRDRAERLGRYRCVVEHTQAWLHQFRRLGVRYERQADLLQELLHLACALVCLRFLTHQPVLRQVPSRVASAH